MFIITKKMGRPKAAKPKSVEFGVCFDVETAEKLQSYCKRHSISKGEAVRRGVNKLLQEERSGSES